MHLKFILATRNLEKDIEKIKLETKYFDTYKIDFEEKEILKYMSDILEPIKYMHDKKIPHRDLKPASVYNIRYF